jgi:RNA polymerase sigma factor (sigma-70 family)
VPAAPLVGVEELVRRAQRGDAVALERLVAELLPYLGRICGAIALERGDDALQEAMIMVVRKIGTLREPAAVRGWARRIAVREAVRAAQVTPAGSVDPDALASTVDLTDHATEAEVRSVLASLPPEQRTVLVLRHVDGLSESEVAEVLDVAVGTVKSRTSRARQAFRERWSA